MVDSVVSIIEEIASCHECGKDLHFCDKCEEEFFDYQTIECDKKTKQHFHVGCEKL